jgi:hypothetical protein
MSKLMVCWDHLPRDGLNSDAVDEHGAAEAGRRLRAELSQTVAQELQRLPVETGDMRLTYATIGVPSWTAA